MKHIILYYSDNKGKCYEVHYGHPALKENDQAPSKRRKWDCTICRLSLTPRGRPTGSTRMCPWLTLPFTRVKQKRQDKVMWYYKCICRYRFISRLYHSWYQAMKKRCSIAVMLQLTHVAIVVAKHWKERPQRDLELMDNWDHERKRELPRSLCHDNRHEI